MSGKNMTMDYALSNFHMFAGVPSRNDGKKLSLSVYGGGYIMVYHSVYATTYHRLVYWLTRRKDPKYIDHRDGNCRNNHPDNLRSCTQSQNNANSGLNKVNTSGFKGVTWNKRASKWHAQIKDHGKRVYLGIYDDIEDAARAYDKAAIEIHGEFAKTNKMLGLI